MFEQCASHRISGRIEKNMAICDDYEKKRFMMRKSTAVVHSNLRIRVKKSKWGTSWYVEKRSGWQLRGKRKRAVAGYRGTGVAIVEEALNGTY